MRPVGVSSLDWPGNSPDPGEGSGAEIGGSGLDLPAKGPRPVSLQSSISPQRPCVTGIHKNGLHELLINAWPSAFLGYDIKRQ